MPRRNLKKLRKKRREDRHHEREEYKAMGSKTPIARVVFPKCMDSWQLENYGSGESCAGPIVHRGGDREGGKYYFAGYPLCDKHAKKRGIE